MTIGKTERHVSAHAQRNLGARRNETDIAAEKFLEMLIWMRDVFLQDAAMLMDHMHEHPLYAHPLLQQPEFLAFKQQVQDECRRAAQEENLLHGFTVRGCGQRRVVGGGQGAVVWCGVGSGTIGSRHATHGLTSYL